MKYIFSISVLLFSFLIGCGQQSSLENKRKESISKIMASITTFDTISLYKLIDTSYAISASLGKEEWLKEIKGLYHNFKENNVHINKNDFLLVNDWHLGETYKVVVPVPKNECCDSVSICFRFRNGEYKMVYQIEAIWNVVRNSKIDTTPFINAPKNPN